MSEKLKDKLTTELADIVDVGCIPVDSSEGKPKVYKIEIAGNMFFDWVMADGKPDVNKAPGDAWKTPLNFETHKEYFGPGMGEEGGEAKDKMYAELVDAIKAKAAEAPKEEAKAEEAPKKAAEEKPAEKKEAMGTPEVPPEAVGA